MRDQRSRLARRAGVGAAVGAAALLLATPPAGAAECGDPVTIEPFDASVLTVGVRVGDEPTAEVLVQLPEEVEMTDAPEITGWVVSTDDGGPWLSFTGQEIAANECATFDIPVRAIDVGTFRVNVFYRLPDGEMTQYPEEGEVFEHDGGTVVVDREGPPNPLYEQVVTVATPSDGSSVPVAALVGGAAAVVAIGFFVLRRSRSRPRVAPSDEVSPSP